MTCALSLQLPPDFPFVTHLLQEFNFLLFGVENSQGLLMLQLQLLPPFSSLSHMLFQRKQKSCQETLACSTCSPTGCRSQARRRSSQQKHPLVALTGKRESGADFHSVSTERHIARLNSGMLTALSSRRHDSVVAGTVAALMHQGTAPTLSIQHTLICGVVLKKNQSSGKESA